ncbi:DUF7350 domain-containing protein [Haloarchaeobius iranensis]|uniref:DUF7350 domain-containing protein n=1 Tax=Haloarchaeobius iranensis TaxID=996166 RepID=UPI0011137DC7
MALVEGSADTLSRTVDPLLGAHYGAPAPELASGDRVTLTVLTPPQASRHEGYETAFFRDGVGDAAGPLISPRPPG